MNQVLIAGGVFLLTYALIVTERVHRTLAALAGGIAMIILGVLSQQQAFVAVDWNVIFLLAGMMSIANVLRETGLFQWIAVQSVRLGRGRPFAILAILSLVTALSSALLDNVTIVVLVAPVTLFVAASLRLSPVPFLIAEILASNIGGTATLIGDPPNILIGSAAHLDFLTFAANLTPISLLILVAFVGQAWFMFRAELRVKVDGAVALEAGLPASARGESLMTADLRGVDAASLITNRQLLRKGLIVMGGVIVGFLVHGMFNLLPATIALGGAVVLMLWARLEPYHVLRDVEWTTLFFFIGLFIIIEAVVRVGIIEGMARAALRLTGGNVRLTAMLLLWLSALISGLVDNIPYTATMIPLVQSLAASMPAEPLWWSLALGACLGGNATLVGASANVVVASLAERSGHPLTFKMFLLYGVPVTLVSLLLSTFYIWWRYL